MAKFVTAAVTDCQPKSVTAGVTTVLRLHGIVPVMVTQRPKVPKHGKKPPPPPQPVRQTFYLMEWRKFMGIKPTELAEALDIERQSYHRLEKNWWTINLGELDIICRTLGVKQSQLRFPPPKKGEPKPETVDDLMEDIPEDMQPAAFLALRGMARR